MTLLEAISHIDLIKPNSYSQQDKIRWLSTLDGIIKHEIIDTHTGGEGVSFEEYTDLTPLTQDLLVPHPYDEIYIRWLEAQIDYANGEYGKYNNSITMYNTALSGYEKYYNRTHLPLGKTWTHF